MSRSWSDSCLGDAILGYSEDIPHHGRCLKGQIPQHAMLQRPLPKYETLGCQHVGGHRDFPKVDKGGNGRRLWLGGLHTIGTERAFHVLCGCGGK